MKENLSVVELIRSKRVKNLNEMHQEKLTFGEQVSDKIAEVAGSWMFILTFMFLLVSWISLNYWVLVSRPFDPYPFILLNLVLSCIAALQAPIIMMPQNRQESKDRLRAENDFLIDQKTEIIIEELYTKICALEENLNKYIIKNEDK